MSPLSDQETGFCLDCNYPLRGLGERRCPECGRRFDPSDPHTMNMGRPLGPWARRLLLPAGWTINAAIAAACLWALWVATDPGLYYLFGQYLLLILLWVGCSAVWAGRAGLRAWVALSHKQPLTELPSDGRRWWWMRVMLGLVTLLVILKVPVRVAFLFARPGLEQLVGEVGSASRPILPSDRRVGPYLVRATGITQHSPGVIVIRLAGGLGEGAFIYSPDRDPSGHYNDGDHGRLMGPWYWCAED